MAVDMNTRTSYLVLNVVLNVAYPLGTSVVGTEEYRSKYGTTVRWVLVMNK